MNIETPNRGSGQAFTEKQKATDHTINERIREEDGSEKLDPSKANDKKRRNRVSDTATKKTGAGTQKNPGM